MIAWGGFADKEMAVHHQICHQHLLEISYFALLHVIPNTTCASSTSVGFTSQRAIHANCCPFPEVHPTREPGTRQHTGRINCSCSRNVPQTAELPQDPGGAAGVCSSLNAHTGHKPSSSGCAHWGGSCWISCPGNGWEQAAGRRKALSALLCSVYMCHKTKQTLSIEKFLSPSLRELMEDANSSALHILTVPLRH